MPFIQVAVESSQVFGVDAALADVRITEDPAPSATPIVDFRHHPERAIGVRPHGNNTVVVDEVELRIALLAVPFHDHSCGNCLP